MYAKIGAFDAKATLSALLQDVQKGNKYTITLRGRAVADLVPNKASLSQDVQAAIYEMQSIKKVKNVSPEIMSEWIAEGRK
jgi:antitoxin (DNA-binding transcriptional repressor) of toxin-antitoxin stability system